MIEGHQSERGLRNLAQTRSVSRRIKEKGLSAEFVVSEIISTLKNTFGEGIIPAMEGSFESAYKISFNDNSIFDYPDRFAEALLYAFGVGREPMLRLINERLASSLHLQNSEELADSGVYGYVLLTNLIKRKID
jgi:hypothetical protein